MKIDKILRGAFQLTFDMKQGDGLLTTLFIIVLHKVIKPIYQNGTLFNKSTQIYAYADDISVVARTKTDWLSSLKN